MRAANSTRCADRPQTLETAERRTVDRLRDLILSGEMLPGQQLRQASIAERLEVSRVPVREALAELLAEGTVVHVPNVGYTVARFSLDDLRQLYRMLDLLEGEMLQAVSTLPKEAATAMAACDRQMRVAARQESVREFLRLNREFHFIGYRLSGRARMLEAAERLWNVTEFYRTLSAFDPARLRQSAEEHAHLVALARRGSVASFRRASDAHRDKGMQRLDAIARTAGHPMIAIPTETRPSTRNP
jgi:DNA-binding GntR family transcriptional regulator